MTTDSIVESLAEALFARDHGAYSETAHPDHNRWTWRGDGYDDAYKNEWLETARAAISALDLTERTRVDYEIAYQGPDGMVCQHGGSDQHRLADALREHPERYHPDAAVWRITWTWSQTKPETTWEETY